MMIGENEYEDADVIVEVAECDTSSDTSPLPLLQDDDVMMDPTTLAADEVTCA